MKRAFLDANIILDLIDSSRLGKSKSTECVKRLMLDDYELLTSCDIFTTVYYVASKSMNSKEIVYGLGELLKIFTIVPIDADIIKKALDVCSISHSSDFEDVLQYVCAKKFDCDVILTNDKSFYSQDIRVIGCQ